VASVTKPAGWWTGNVVKYDTIVELPTTEGLKPGMSVEVEVIIAQHEDVLLIPTAAVLETANGHVCWVKQGDGATRRLLELGDSSDMFIVVETGITEGDEVILDPLANVEAAQVEAANSLDRGDNSQKPNSADGLGQPNGD
jgi:HlyD family secretion protein